MTVAAVILSESQEGALADALGQPRVRRLVDVAWSGGAMPVIVLSPDTDGAVARSLTGTEAVLAIPALPEAGSSAHLLQGAELAMTDVRGTTALLVWPTRMAWVGPETVTSLIEAHGTDPDTMLLPAWRGDPGWPALLPLAHLLALQAMDPTQLPDDAILALSRQVPTRHIELGDPGATHDAATPYHELPAYEGPPDPPAGHTHEWGEDVAAEAGLPQAPDQGD